MASRRRNDLQANALPPPRVGVLGADHLMALSKLKLHDKIKSRVENSCLYKYAMSMKDFIRLDSNLSSLLASTYANSCFYIRNRILYFSLEDIFYITGLPITGKPIVDSEENPSEICLQLLGFGGQKGVNIDLHHLRPYLDVPDDADDETLDRHARVYLLHIIGYVIHPLHRNRFTVPVMFVRLLSDLVNVDSYAWGAGLLANIHHTLTKDVKTLAAPLLPLHIFAMIRFPGLATYYHVLRDEIPTSFPLVNGWTKLMKRRCRDTSNPMDIEELLGPMEEVEFVVEPYVEATKTVPPHLKRQIWMFHVDVPLICCNKLWFHIGIKDVVVQMRSVETINLRKIFKTREGDPRNWLQYYSSIVEQWRKIQDDVQRCFNILAPADPPVDTSFSPSRRLHSPIAPLPTEVDLPPPRRYPNRERKPTKKEDYAYSATNQRRGGRDF